VNRLRGLVVLAAAAVAAGGAPARAAEKEAAPHGPPFSFTQFTPVNTADLPGRCEPAQIYIDTDAFAWKHFADVPSPGGADDQAIASLFENANGDGPSFATYFWTRTNYYARRREVQAKVEARLASLPKADRAHALDNYAYVLGYLGEFRRSIELFGPGGRWERPKDGIVALTLAHAYFRLGRYPESVRYAKLAFDLLPNKVLDTRWQVMISELGLYGEDIFKNYSRKYYNLEHVEKLFPNHDWSALPFDDVTERMKIDRWSGTGGANFADLDGDGWDELIIQRKYFPSRIYKNDGGRAFTAIPDSAVEGPYCDELVESVADFDGDGKPDLLRQCCNYDGPGPHTLLKNMGGLTFKDVTKASGLDYHTAGMHVAWADTTLDGRLDLVVASLFAPVQLWHNNGDGTFTNVTEKAGIVTPGQVEQYDLKKIMDTKSMGAVGCAWGDYDGDRYPDLACNGWGWSKVWHNNGDGTFTDMSGKIGIDDGRGTRGYNSMWLDYNNTGRLSLYAGRYVVASGVSWSNMLLCTCSNLLSKDGFSERDWINAGTIYRNNGDGTFTDMRRTLNFLPMGVMGVAAGDWDNDGCTDIVMGSGGPYAQQAEPYLFYHNNCDGTFTLQTPFAYRSMWGKGHGIAFGDYDHDGNLDVFMNNGGLYPGDLWPSVLLHNRGNSNHWLEVGLRGGPGTNYYAVGAQVEIWAGKLHQLQELAAGGGFSVTNTLRLHFGLGKNARVDRLVVRWPNRKKDVSEFKDLPADRAIEIAESGGGVKTLWTAPR
jgi:tetratricopeptide (TPR) repeat protein